MKTIYFLIFSVLLTGSADFSYAQSSGCYDASLNSSQPQIRPTPVEGQEVLFAVEYRRMSGFPGVAYYKGTVEFVDIQNSTVDIVERSPHDGTRYHTAVVLEDVMPPVPCTVRTVSIPNSNRIYTFRPGQLVEMQYGRRGIRNFIEVRLVNLYYGGLALLEHESSGQQWIKSVRNLRNISE